MRIVTTGLLAAYPLGGVSCDYLGYVRGFRRLGAEVLYLEDTGQWLYDPRRMTFTDEVSSNVRYLQQTLAAVSPETRWSFRGPDGAYRGAGEAEVAAFCRSADLFLNVSGCCWLRDAYRGARHTVYLDTDPGYSQAKLAAVRDGTAGGDTRFSVDLILSHDRFFTYAENIGAADCRIPDCGLRWQTTRQPMVMKDWPMAYRPDAEFFTTVMSWKTDVAPPIIGGVSYGGKNVEFMRFVDLPRLTTARLEIAVGGEPPREELRAGGWRVVDAAERSLTVEAYADYLRGSRGEWSVAKNAYVATRSGWFSGRSATYLALGKPVVTQDTGFSPYFPPGLGLQAFCSLEEAAAALDAVQSDYRRSCEAARALAESEFESDRVLSKLLRDLESEPTAAGGLP